VGRSMHLGLMTGHLVDAASLGVTGKGRVFRESNSADFNIVHTARARAEYLRRRAGLDHKF